MRGKCYRGLDVSPAFLVSNKTTTTTVTPTTSTHTYKILGLVLDEDSNYDNC